MTQLETDSPVTDDRPVEELDQSHQSADRKPSNADSTPDPSSPEKRKRQRWFFLIGIIVLLIGGVFGWRWWQHQRTHPSTDNAQIKGHPSPVAAKINATVQQVLVRDGDYVEAGQTLVILEDHDLTLKARQAEANLASAQAQLKSAKDTVPYTSQTNQAQVRQSQSQVAADEAAVTAAQATVVQAQATVKTNQAKVDQAQATLTDNQTTFQRYEAVYKEGGISAQQLDSYRTNVKTAQANVAAARQTVEQSVADVGNAQAQLQKAIAQAEATKAQLVQNQVGGQQVGIKQDDQQQYQAQVKQQTANLALARQQIKYLLIKAPVSGYVGNLTAQVGQRVQAEQPMLSLVPLYLDRIYVDANFKETAIRNFRIGQPTEVRVDAYPGQVFRATIAGISPATGATYALLPPDNATGNYNKVVQWVPIRLTFQPDTDPQHKLRAGLSVTVTVDTSGK
ncbi:MAG: HlyD family secretion protein [Stenomitos rutilans HA7619-LM2]|jgi:membrane fusion protein (multidrug efflux system)|nr:HlyD family secretion protein [Stenomitos rutilans HA7619-LM2]